MTKRLDVAMAIKQLIENALPGAEVLGLDGKEVPAGRVGDGGRVIVRAGDPGAPVEVTLSPTTYWWDHVINVELIRAKRAGVSSEEALDELISAVNDAIVANRTLDGKVDWLDAAPADTETISVTNDSGVVVSTPVSATEIPITASYSTSGPLA